MTAEYRTVVRRDDPSVWLTAGFEDFEARADIDWTVWAIVPGRPPTATPLVERSINERLEVAFMAMLPAHLGQPYLTPAVVNAIMATKQAITNANQIDATGTLAVMTLQGLALPPEMESARAALLDMFTTTETGV